MDDAKIAVVGFGISRAELLFRLFATATQQRNPGRFGQADQFKPFPEKVHHERSQTKSISILVVEMNSGMMLDDVISAAQGKAHVEFYGSMGGLIPFPDEILAEIERLIVKAKPV